MFHAPLKSLFSKLAFVLAPALLAQSGPMPPPPLMLFVREEVKPGHGAAHAATESAWTRALVRGKSQDHYLGMSAMTGASEAWFIMGYASYADWEAKQNEFDKNPALKAEIDPDAWATLYATTSRPFPRPSTGKIAIKVINHYGDEIVQVYDIPR